MDLAEFNKLLKNPNYHPLYTALESMSVDDLIGLLHRAGFQCGTAQDFKRVILWAVGDELVAKKMAALDINPSKKIMPAQFAELLKKIHGHFIKIESSELFDKSAANKVTFLIEKLEELRRLDPFADHQYVPDQIVTAVELRMHRWLWRYQSMVKNNRSGQKSAQTSRTPASVPKAAPSLIPLLNTIAKESRATAAAKKNRSSVNRTG
jgi:hypothetical protein